MVNRVVPQKEKHQFSTNIERISEHDALKEDKEVKSKPKPACSALVKPSCL